MHVTPFEAFLISVAIAAAAKTLAWLVQLRTRNGGLVDVVWAATLGGLAVFYAVVGDAPVSVRVAMGVMGGLWGLTQAFRFHEPPVIAFVLAGLVWIVSLAAEGIADRQMERFRADPANRAKVCRTGLWRWSRHPNYFFECLHWFAYVVLAWGMAGWGWTLAAPIVMAFLLLRFSGMPLMEAEMVRRKPDYDRYIRTTSALIPLPPKCP
jgi:steroid 5-alpha reductase family enzyme